MESKWNEYNIIYIYDQPETGDYIWVLIPESNYVRVIKFFS